MKVSKAIEVLEFRVNETESYIEIDERDAVKLGIEALKRVQLIRLHKNPGNYRPLTGETPEEARHEN